MISEVQEMLDRERISKEKITEMHNAMNLSKNKVKLKEELEECDRRIHFLCTLQSTLIRREDPHDFMNDLHNLGLHYWSTDKLSIGMVKYKIRELSFLLCKEEKLCNGFVLANAKVEGEESLQRVGLLKEALIKYTSLLPPSFAASHSDEITCPDVHRGNGRLAKVIFKVSRVSLDRFDDVPVKICLTVNGKKIMDMETEGEASFKDYDSAHGCKVEMYISRRNQAVAMACFHLISTVCIQKQRLFLEPKGRCDMSVTFITTASDRLADRQLKRADAITRKRFDGSVFMGHRFKPSKAVLPVQCAHCHTMCLDFSPLRCLDCSFVCHKHCMTSVVAKCVPNCSKGEGHQSALATFNVPHAFSLSACMSPTACCVHCGRLIGIANQQQSCRECGRWAHSNCLPYIPAHCGLTSEMKRQLPLTHSLEALAELEIQDPLKDRYEFIRTIGRGSFGKVIMGKDVKDHGKLVAIKILKKAEILRHDEVEHVQTEFRVLSLIKRYKNPFCIGLLDTFQTDDRVYFVSEFVSGGDMMFHIQNRPFTIQQSK